ncbi:MAG: DUF1826 domain-containing protein [Aureispira sp.]|nr:DUF1826 domain-containing protein [Aureispira sp.]
MITQAVKSAAIGSDFKILKDIHEESKNIAIYQRSTQTLNQELEQLMDYDIEFRSKGSVSEIIQALQNYFDIDELTVPVFFEDVINLLKKFEELTKANSFRIFLAVVDSNMCRRFHTDINYLRLLCTYVGQGTLWLPDTAVDWKAYTAHVGNEQIVKDKELIQQVDAGDVTILKGALYPNAKPIMHRSPSIEETAEERLLLRIDINQSLDNLS